MKLAHFGLLAAAGTIAVSVAFSRQPGEKTPASQPAPAAAKSGEDNNLRLVLDMFRSDMNASKIFTLNQVMKLTASQAAKFWPIYQKYEADLGAVDDRRIALIRQFVALSEEGKLSDQNASEIADQWLQVTQDRLSLWKKYHKEISGAVSPIVAAQFLQVEHQISLLVDINIASEMPLVKAPK